MSAFHEDEALAGILQDSTQPGIEAIHKILSESGFHPEHVVPGVYDLLSTTWGEAVMWTFPYAIEIFRRELKDEIIQRAEKQLLPHLTPEIVGQIAEERDRYAKALGEIVLATEHPDEESASLSLTIARNALETRLANG